MPIACAALALALDADCPRHAHHAGADQIGTGDLGAGLYCNPVSAEPITVQNFQNLIARRTAILTLETELCKKRKDARSW
jgi:hypothetical protein